MFTAYGNIRSYFIVSQTKQGLDTMQRGRGKGFTIVELLIVVVVIAILAAITVVSYNGITAQAEDSALKTALKQPPIK